MPTETSGQSIVSAPAIRHGEPTFRGTRILVADVLEQVESGMAWEAIIEEWRYEIDKRRDCRSSPHGSCPSMALAKHEGQKWTLNHCGAKVHYLGNNDREVNHARIKKALTITR